MNGNSTAQIHFTMEHTTKTLFKCSGLSKAPISECTGDYNLRIILIFIV